MCSSQGVYLGLIKVALYWDRKQASNQPFLERHTTIRSMAAAFRMHKLALERGANEPSGEDLWHGLVASAEEVALDVGIQGLFPFLSFFLLFVMRVPSQISRR